ncbi:uncharacterized protein [Clytia hemisphaerica]|uniref:uncharacterized protein n=1 Tax=Clytia hemisphaerica TaxID=252671 RepID=UPI0034D6D176
MKDKRKYCNHCKLTFSRSHYYALGHNKGLCLQKIAKKKTQTVTTDKLFTQSKSDDGMQQFETTSIINDTVSVADVLESFTEETGISSEHEMEEDYPASPHDTTDESDSSSEEDEEVESNEQTREMSPLKKCLSVVLRIVFLFQVHTFTSNASIILLLGAFKVLWMPSQQHFIQPTKLLAYQLMTLTNGLCAQSAIPSINLKIVF